MSHKRELVCFALGNLLSDWRCGRFKTGKSSNNYSAWKELGGDPLEACTQLQSGWQHTASLYQPGFTYTHRSSQLQQQEYFSFYQGASSSCHVHISAAFLGNRKPGNIHKLLANNSLSTSQKLHLQKPRWGLWSQRLAPGLMLLSVCSLSVFSERRHQCANLCCFVAKGNMGTFTHHFCGCPGSAFA